MGKQIKDAKTEADELLAKAEEETANVEDVKVDGEVKDSLIPEIEPEKEKVFTTYDHMVKANGIYYKAGEEVPFA